MSLTVFWGWGSWWWQLLSETLISLLSAVFCICYALEIPHFKSRNPILSLHICAKVSILERHTSYPTTYTHTHTRTHTFTGQQVPFTPKDQKLK